MATRIPLARRDRFLKTEAERLQMSTAEIGLSVRTTNCLEERGIFTVRDLLNCTPEKLLEIQNFGEKTLEEVYRSLASVGFYRPGYEPVGRLTVRSPSISGVGLAWLPAGAGCPRHHGDPIPVQHRRGQRPASRKTPEKYVFVELFLEAPLLHVGAASDHMKAYVS